MPFRVTVRAPGETTFTPIPDDRLAALMPTDAVPAEPAVIWKSAVPAPCPLVPGVIRTAYEREGRANDPEYLDIDAATPRRQELSGRIEPNENPAQVVVYDGWFEAPTDGVYVFDLPFRRSGYTHLGSFRHAYQSQLRVADEIVLQRGVAGRIAPGRIGLKAGWHLFSLRLGSSSADLTVTYPDGQTVPLTAARLRRAANLAPFSPGPEAALIARFIPGVTPAGDPGFRAWIAGFASVRTLDRRPAVVAPLAPPLIVASGPGGVDINMTRGAGRVPLKFHFLKMRDPDFTVGMWFRSDTGDGRLFGKQGLTAFGKSYKTVSVSVSGGKLRATPGGLSGGAVEPGRWHHATLSATPTRLGIYLDGELVDEGPGAPGLATDALDFLPDHAGAIGEILIYNRELSAADVARLFRASK
ncbi:MAG: LamG domain-containing protein [Planctomycetia bacterium]|nr:LamG domain-containing protein [Planctomycetia bacterium]